ncbi:MAG: aminoacyl-tRNA hydrolase [Muribaculaceae bacterium]|nr:aminoacyl-tRNA hydrolase [Muribaculaceae bacterium]
MKRFLIVGLGNMGLDYEGTRHNIGFMIANKLAEESQVKFTSCRYGDMAKVRIKNCELLILKPSTFMNLSGVAVRYWMNKEKLPLDHLLILVDDLALPLGTIRIRENGSEAGHNGLKNITDQLGTRNYARLRFGIGNDFPKGSQVDFVLSRFADEEQTILRDKIGVAADAVKAFCLSGAAFAMNHFNK